MPSTVVVVMVCENETPIDGDPFRTCGSWAIVTRGDELPFCHRCKQRQRTWRLATEQEIAARDRAFLASIERALVME